MKAIVYHDYGLPEVLKCEEVEKPTPGDDEVLIRVRTAAVNPLDWHLMRGKPYIGRLFFGLRPRMTRPGRDVAGQIESIGRNVTQFKPGDEVFGTCHGAFAEYACARPSSVVIKPVNVTFEQAASAPVAGFTALQALRDKGRIRPGQKVLINGAAGGVGTFAVQIAKSFGAEVTGVCSTRNVETVRSIGAAHVIDYTREDFTRQGKHYDLILDVVANHSLSARRRALNPNGICVMVSGPNESRSLTGLVAQWIGGYVLSKLLDRKEVLCVARMNKEDLAILADLMASGRVRPIIDVRHGLSEVREAVRYLGTGHARGKIVINISENRGQSGR